MTISLFVEPRKVYSREEFVASKPSFSIALDGFVSAPTFRDSRGPYANFDHHVGVDRFATRCTAEQVRLEINMGLYETFRKGGIPHANVFVNDPDEDTCLAWWLLANHELVTNHAKPAINRLVSCEDLLDCTAGAYRLGQTGMRRKMAWVFEPYNAARFSGRIALMGAGEMRNVMEAVSARISQHVLNGGEELPLEGHYEKIGGGLGWVLTKETGPASRLAMYADGITAFVALVAEKPDSSFVYTGGRRSVWTPFDKVEICAALNEAEGNIITPSNKWDGSDTVWGSPRETGSRLPHERLQEIINGVVGK